MKIVRFEDLIAWQKAKELAIDVYKTFENSKDFRFKNQIESAAVSVMNNIAEGFDRRTNNEFKHFLYIAKGSCAEVRSMLYLAIDLGKISQNDFQRLYNLSDEVSKLIYGLIKSLG